MEITTEMVVKMLKHGKILELIRMAKKVFPAFLVYDNGFVDAIRGHIAFDDVDFLNELDCYIIKKRIASFKKGSDNK